jgi:hypothetical protein
LIAAVDEGVRSAESGSSLSMEEAKELIHKCSLRSASALNEAEALAERVEQCDYNAELHRLRGVFLTALGAEETQIEASFCEAIRVAQEQKSCSLAHV